MLSSIFKQNKNFALCYLSVARNAAIHQSNTHNAQFIRTFGSGSRKKRVNNKFSSKSSPNLEEMAEEIIEQEHKQSKIPNPNPQLKSPNLNQNLKQRAPKSNKNHSSTIKAGTKNAMNHANNQHQRVNNAQSTHFQKSDGDKIKTEIQVDDDHSNINTDDQVIASKDEESNNEIVQVASKSTKKKLISKHKSANSDYDYGIMFVNENPDGTTQFVPMNKIISDDVEDDEYDNLSDFERNKRNVTTKVDTSDEKKTTIIGQSIGGEKLQSYDVSSMDSSVLTETFSKGGGKGGQKVNKTNNCVLLRHEPTGTIVKCHATRSLSQNRLIARNIMQERLEELLLGSESRKQIKIAKIRKKKDRQRRKREKRMREKSPQQDDMQINDNNLEHEDNLDNDIDTDINIQTKNNNTRSASVNNSSSKLKSNDQEQKIIPITELDHLALEYTVQQSKQDSEDAILEQKRAKLLAQLDAKHEKLKLIEQEMHTQSIKYKKQSTNKTKFKTIAKATE
jgi:protein subunit release factor B